MKYRILFIVDGVTDDWIEQDDVNLQALDKVCKLNNYLGGLNLKYRVLKRNAQGKWILYLSNKYTLSL